MGSAVGKHEGRTAAIRRSRAPIQRAWKPPPLVPVMARRLAVDVVPREEDVGGPHAVPHRVAHQAGAGERREVAENGVLAADQVVAAAPARLVPELAALALADGVPAEHDVPAPHEAGGDLLVVGVGLPDLRVAAGEEHRRLLPGRCVRHVDERGDVDAGQALEDDLLDPVAVHRDRPGDADVERRPRLGQAADEREGLAAELVLEGPEVGLGLHAGEALLPGRVAAPRLARAGRRGTA